PPHCEDDATKGAAPAIASALGAAPWSNTRRSSRGRKVLDLVAHIDVQGTGVGVPAFGPDAKPAGSGALAVQEIVGSGHSDTWPVVGHDQGPRTRDPERRFDG